VLSTIFIAAAGYLINDLMDTKADAINNNNEKSIFVKKNKKFIRTAYYTLSLIGIIAAFYLAVKVNEYSLGFIQVIAVLLLYFYSASYKKNILIGNLVIAFLSTLVIVTVCLFEFYALMNDGYSIDLNIWFFFLLGFFLFFSFFFTLSREIVKDIEDLEGDKQSGYNTLAVVFGVRKTKNIALWILLFTVVLLLISIYLMFISGAIMLFLHFCFIVIPIVVWIFVKLVKANIKEDYHSIQMATKLLMFFGILSMLWLPGYSEFFILY
jgi:4-hydroxybenzoate polyprenyltransferase